MTDNPMFTPAVKFSGCQFFTSKESSLIFSLKQKISAKQNF